MSNGVQPAWIKCPSLPQFHQWSSRPPPMEQLAKLSRHPQPFLDILCSWQKTHPFRQQTREGVVTAEITNEDIHSCLFLSFASLPKHHILVDQAFEIHSAGKRSFPSTKLNLSQNTACHLVDIRLPLGKEAVEMSSFISAGCKSPKSNFLLASAQ